MCNLIHLEHSKISVSGKGWKLFSIDKNKKLRGLMHCQYSTNPNNGVKWNEEDDDDSGFCFFRTKKEGKRALKSWKIFETLKDNTVLKRIEYKKGLCKQEEHMFISGSLYTIALCQYFKVIGE